MDVDIANDTKFSSPMPAIGLYMAVATLNANVRVRIEKNGRFDKDNSIDGNLGLSTVKT
ncbi:hypothetical protein Syun_031871 [Stephania yunnanensis]|uniref:Uncharacterized protein n=1 Tax=Stephania yunnanensis TaxID=152371 RepID=A0AAP0HGU4_9MAGN